MSSQPLKQAGAAHAGVGQGSWAAKQALVGCCRLRAGRDEGCLAGVSGQKGVQEKTSQGGSLCPQPLSVTTSSVEQIYIKTILEHKKGHKTRLLYRGTAPGVGLGHWYTIVQELQAAPSWVPAGLPGGLQSSPCPPAGSWECVQLVPSPCRLHVRGEVKCVAFQLSEGDGRMLQVVEKDLDLGHHIVGPDVGRQGEVSFALHL